MVFSLFDIHSVPPSPAINILAQTVCNENSSLQGFCIFFIDLFAGFDAEQVDKVFENTTISNLVLRKFDILMINIFFSQHCQCFYQTHLTVYLLRKWIISCKK